MRTILKKIKNAVLDILGKSEEIVDEQLLGAIDSTRFVVLDTETTGFDYEKDRILSIGALVLQNNQMNISDSFEVFIQQEHYDQATAKIHGILRDSVLDRPNEKEALEQFLTFLGDAIIVAHHSLFDLSMITKALERNCLSPLKNKTLDTPQS